MKHLHIFNPDNDLALASGLDYYTAPPMAAKLGLDLQMLPAWWADDGDSILALPSPQNAQWAEHLHDIFGINIDLIDKNHLQNHTFCYRPWGWNLSLRNQLLSCSVPEEHLPQRAEIKNWRELSHRRVTIRIHRRISQLLGSQPYPTPQEFFSLRDVERFSLEHPRCFLKAPWSSSGKGIFRPTGTDNLTFSYWANGILQRQGSIIAEEAMNKTMDFAMEFRCAERKAEFIGYSIYSNNLHNAFNYGLVANEDVLHQKLCDEIGKNGNEQINRIKAALITTLNEVVAPYYDGFLGIDMLVFLDDSEQKHINPCVEMNLRCTMGVVTSIVGKRFFHPHSIGRYHVEFRKAPFDISAYMQQKISEQPPIVETINGLLKIKSGTILMAPVYPDSRYCAYIEAQSI